MNQDLEKLIDIAAKGDKVTSRQKELILNKAIVFNEDPDEIEYLLDMKYKDYHKKVKEISQANILSQEYNEDYVDESDDSKEGNIGDVVGKKIAKSLVNAGKITFSKNSKGKSRLTACLLAIFFGGIGIHKFYIGNTKSGILYILFCWTFIPMILGWIDAFVFMLESEGKFYNQIK